MVLTPRCNVPDTCQHSQTNKIDILINNHHFSYTHIYTHKTDNTTDFKSISLSELNSFTALLTKATL